MIQKLIGKVKEFGILEEDLKEWLPVYGTILGVFNIKRELRPLEFGKLKQAIYNLEKNISQPDNNSPKDMPQLINCYFWLIDHYISTKEDQSKISEVLSKLKHLNIKIYNEYIQ